jgi:superfamily II DNA helicase RecQ
MPLFPSWNCHSFPTLVIDAARKVREDVIKSLGLANPELVIAPFDRPNIYYEIRYKAALRQSLNDDILEFILSLSENGPVGGLVYAGTRAHTESIATYLQHNGIASC